MKRYTLPALALVLLSATAIGATTLLHFELRESLPADGTTVAEVEAVELWFTQVPQDSATVVRLIDAGGDLVETAALIQNPEDGKHFRLPVESDLTAGAYTVSWRSMAADGHVVRGDFGFTLTAR